MWIKQYKYFYIVAAPQESLNFQGEEINIVNHSKTQKETKDSLWEEKGQNAFSGAIRKA